MNEIFSETEHVRVIGGPLDGETRMLWRNPDDLTELLESGYVLPFRDPLVALWGSVVYEIVQSSASFEESELPPYGSAAALKEKHLKLFEEVRSRGAAEDLIMHTSHTELMSRRREVTVYGLVFGRARP